MLILTRRVGETLMIGNDITVTVLGVNGKQVRFGVSAPDTTAIHREEIYKKIEAENKEKALQQSREFDESSASMHFF